MFYNITDVICILPNTPCVHFSALYLQSSTHTEVHLTVTNETTQYGKYVKRAFLLMFT
jgi:hypothetical protein